VRLERWVAASTRRATYRLNVCSNSVTHRAHSMGGRDARNRSMRALARVATLGMSSSPSATSACNAAGTTDERVTAHLPNTTKRKQRPTPHKRKSNKRGPAEECGHYVMEQTDHQDEDDASEWRDQGRSRRTATSATRRHTHRKRRTETNSTRATRAAWWGCSCKLDTVLRTNTATRCAA